MCLKTFLFNYHRNSQVNHSIDKESKTKKVIEYENKDRKKQGLGGFLYEPTLNKGVAVGSNF